MITNTQATILNIIVLGSGAFIYLPLSAEASRWTAWRRVFWGELLGTGRRLNLSCRYDAEVRSVKFLNSSLRRKFVDDSEVISSFSDYDQLNHLSEKNRLYFCGNSQGGCGIRFIMHATRHSLRRHGKSYGAASRYRGVVVHCHVVEYNIYSLMGTCVAKAANLAWGAQHVFIIRGWNYGMHAWGGFLGLFSESRCGVVVAIEGFSRRTNSTKL